ncbi:serine hydrolase [Sphingobium aromaticiconvertens]|uniref:serine hydrolase n=1 Tax=Sphingobium aromaticiconvertens TaxID=365341 RepID=UPI00301789AD
MIRWLVFLLAALLLSPAALAQSGGQPSPAMQSRAEQLVAMLTAPGNEEDYFSPIFLNAVPITQWRALAEQLRRDHGTPKTLSHLRTQSATIGAVEIRYANATLGFQMVVAPQAPNQVVGLRLTGARQRDDSLAKVAQDIAALAGHAAFALARLTDAQPQLLRAHDADRAMATGSSFKLAILAELARAVAAKERRWADVVPLTHKSFSGRLAAAPDNAPMTLHSLALAMIAESDNSAADTLLLALGRDRVDAMMPPESRPLLTTAEAFALKMPANADLRARYAGATPQGRRDLLNASPLRLVANAIDVGTMATTPTAIDTIEWFASPDQMIGLLDQLRRQSGDALPILAVNPGIAPGDAARWAWLGYKGGSEPGVIAMNFIGRAKDGQWYALAAAWNNSAALVDEGRFTALMSRMLTLIAEGGS